MLLSGVPSKQFRTTRCEQCKRFYFVISAERSSICAWDRRATLVWPSLSKYVFPPFGHQIWIVWFT